MILLMADYGKRLEVPQANFSFGRAEERGDCFLRVIAVFVAGAKFYEHEEGGNANFRYTQLHKVTYVGASKYVLPDLQSGPR
jgi:hypothetical protein